MKVAAILLAAGASARMRGADKLLEPVRGQPLLRDRAKMLLSSPVDELVIVLPPDRPAREAALEGLAVSLVTNPEAATGMASSIRAGIGALGPSVTAALIMPADLPDLETVDIAEVIAAYASAPDSICRGASGARGGSPVIFPRDCFSALMQLLGDKSGRDVIAAHKDRLRLVELEGDRALLDLDTPEAWAEWRKAQDGTS